MPVKNIDEYLSVLPKEVQITLGKLRAAIRTAAPDAEETISYQVPAFRYYGMLVAFAAFKDHCSFFPMNAATTEQFNDELKAFKTAKGTIRFQADKPIPLSLIKKIVKQRMKENFQHAHIKKIAKNGKK